MTDSSLSLSLSFALFVKNIFLDEETNVKIGDFGLAMCYDPERKVEEPVGSLIYASPEVLKREPYVGPELDVWALGVLRKKTPPPTLLLCYQKIRANATLMHQFDLATYHFTSHTQSMKCFVGRLRSTAKRKPSCVLKSCAVTTRCPSSSPLRPAR